MVGLTTATGYLLAAGRFAWGIWLPVVGTFLLASGAVALNQCQDARLDARMERTRGRPIPSGRLDRTSALFVAAILILLGLSLLASVHGRAWPLLGPPIAVFCDWGPLALGGFALLWYNGVYTLLKRVTAYAVLPGALIGAVPPLIGWTAAGGDPRDPYILLIAAFFFLWQIPHFWVLVLIFGDQFASAGLPAITRVFSPPQLGRITFMWICAAAALGLILPWRANGGIALAPGLAMMAGAVWLVLNVAGLLRQTGLRPGQAGRDDPILYRRAFVRINLYGLLMTACLAINAVTRA